jgi:alpha/beta superfamily hydrolase
MSERRFIEGPAGRLQAIYQPGDAERPAVVICHPHPLYGGTMNNKVVYWMAQMFRQHGCAVLRFNFRGVDDSAGSWDDGVGEADDARAALDWLHQQQPGVPLWLAGFSFGCYAGLRAARDDPRVTRLLAVAPAVNHYDFAFMDQDTRPLTVIIGTDDEIVPFADVERWARALPMASFHAIAAAGHFFPDHKQALLAALAGDAFGD